MARNDAIWVTRDKRKIAVGEMEESHVRNTLRMLIRNARRKHDQRLQLITKDENMPPCLFTEPVQDEMWEFKSGRQVPIGQMSETNARAALRRVIHATARAELRRTMDELPFPDESFFERPDNHSILAEMRARHGDAVKVVPKGVAGMGGADVYVNGEWKGWYGGI